MARRRFVPQKVRRPTFWEGTDFNQNVTTGAAIIQSLVSEAVLENSPNPTLIRMRGEGLVTLTASAATPGRCVAFLGIKLTTAAALAGAAVELPSTDIGSEWIWWTAIPLFLSGGSVAAPNSDGRTIVRRFMIDSKAMRKVTQNQVLVMVAQNVVVTSTQTFDVLGGLRILFKR